MSKLMRIWEYGKTFRTWETYKFKKNFKEQVGFIHTRVKQEEAIDNASSKEEPNKTKTILRKKGAMNPGEQIEYLRKYVTLLDQGVCAFNKRIHQPKFDHSSQRFLYEEPNPVIFLVLKMARIVTAFYATLELAKQGLFEDAGAICRIIIECSHDIDFVMEGLTEDPFPANKQEVLDNFFNREIQTPEEMMVTMKKPPTVPRRKVYSAVGRLLSPGDPDRIQHISKVQEELFSGYVHASYPHIMEMYEGIRKEFRMGGVQMRIPLLIKQVALNIHACLNQFAIFAKALSLAELRLQLIESVKEIETSEAYR